MRFLLLVEPFRNLRFRFGQFFHARVPVPPAARIDVHGSLKLFRADPLHLHRLVLDGAAPLRRLLDSLPRSRQRARDVTRRTQESHRVPRQHSQRRHLGVFPSFRFYLRCHAVLQTRPAPLQLSGHQKLLPRSVGHHRRETGASIMAANSREAARRAKTQPDVHS